MVRKDHVGLLAIGDRGAESHGKRLVGLFLAGLTPDDPPTVRCRHKPWSMVGRHGGDGSVTALVRLKQNHDHTNFWILREHRVIDARILRSTEPIE
jgi:hypothetical protein